MAPPDLNQALECENADEQTFLEIRAKRAAVLAATVPLNNTHKGILRQRSNINSIREKIEKTLRSLRDYVPDMAEDQPEKRFNQENKTSKLKDLRAVLLELKRQDDYLIIAKQHSFETADKVEELETNEQLDSDRSKHLSEVLKQKSLNSGGVKGFQRTFKRKYPFAQPQNQMFHPAGAAYYNQFLQQPPLMGPGGYGYPRMQVNAATGAAGGQPFAPQLPIMAKFRPKIDKSKSTCHSCHLQGHWMGDSECPNTQNTIALIPPPGTG